jgi:AraC-like DNA-binding protein
MAERSGASVALGSGPAPCVLAYTPRERARSLVRGLFSRRHARVIGARSAEECLRAFRTSLIDLVLVDAGSATDALWEVAALAPEFPSTPFVAIVPLRAADGPTVARCVGLDFVDLIVEGVDDAAARELIAPYFFSTRFAAALHRPPARLAFSSDVQRATWRRIVAYTGRAVRTEELAAGLGVTREHLSRRFAANGGPNLKRVIDLVRLIAAAELAKNPGYDIRDVSTVLGFASSSHLSSTAQRIVGTKPGSLSALRTVDLVERFAQGRGRSRS